MAQAKAERQRGKAVKRAKAEVVTPCENVGLTAEFIVAGYPTKGQGEKERSSWGGGCCIAFLELQKPN